MNEKLKKKLARQQELADAAKAQKRAMTDEETREFNQLQGEIEEIKRELEGNGENNPEVPDLTGERQRSAEIMELCRKFSISDDKVKSYIKDGTTVDKVRASILEELEKENGPIQTRGTGDINVTKDEKDKFREAAADALVMRGGVAVEKPSDGARELMGMSLRDLAIETLSNEGHAGLIRKSGDELYQMLNRQYFNPTSAFPAILDTAINKAYVEGHNTVPVTFDKWVKIGTLKDFKTHDNNYLAGPAGEFLEVPEGGELKHDIPKDEKLPTRKLKTYGRQFTMTRQAFINDDIDFLSKVPAKYAASARKTQNKQVYQILVNNPAIYDGTALFSAAHKNLLSQGTGVTQTALQKMFMALQLQKDQFGEAIIIRPGTIIVPIGYAFDMYTILESPTIHTDGNTQASNPLYRYRNMIQVIEDPTINVLCGTENMPWWLVGDKSDTDSIQIDFLNGQQVPIIQRAEVPGTLGFVWDVYLDWGISVMDYRGIIKNPGISNNFTL